MSSQNNNDSFRPAPSDKWLWQTDRLDDSYGREGILALEKEAYNTKTFCIALYELIPRLDYHENLKQTLFKIKMYRRIGMVIVWLYGKYLETFFSKATEKDLQGKTLILDDGNTIEETFPLDSRFLILSGSQVID